MVQVTLRILFLTALGLSFWVALSTPVQTGIEHGDKWLHFAAYFGLGLLGLLAWPRHTLAVCVVLLSHGALVEIAQSMTSHRMGDLWDWLADSLGVLAAWTVYRRLIFPLLPAAVSGRSTSD